MSRQTPRRLPLPGLGTCAVIAAALCAAWLIWSEFSGRGPVPDVPPPAERAVTRIQAIEALIARGREGVPELVALLSDVDPKVRRGALYGLGRLGPDAADQLELVRERLADEAAEVRGVAVSTFWRISRDPQIAAPIVAALLGDANEGVREAAATALVTMAQDELQARHRAGNPGSGADEGESTNPRATTEVLRMLDSDSAVARRAALSILGRVLPQHAKAEAEAALRRLLSDPEPALRDQAAGMITAMGMASLNELREALRRQFPPDETSYAPAGHAPVGPPVGSASSAALAAIAARGPDAAELLPDVISIFDRLRVLEHRHVPDAGSGRPRGHDLDAHAAQVLATLAAMKTAARPAVPHLLDRIPELDDMNRTKVAETMLTIGADPSDIIPTLTAILTTEKRIDSADHQALSAAHLNIWEAGKLLVRVSPEEARRQVALAIPRLGSSEPSLNKMALFAIYGLAPEAREAIDAIRPLVRHRDQQVSAIAVDILGQIGPETAAAVPDIVSQIRSSLGSSSQRVWEHFDTIETLGKIGPRAKSAVPLLLELLKDPQLAPHSDEQFPTRFVLSTITTLARIGDGSPEVLAVLRSRLNDDSQWVRAAAAGGLAILARNADAVLGDLLPLLADESLHVRGTAALEIGDLVGDRSRSVAPLVRTLDDEGPYVRTAAAISLGKIGPAAKDSLPALRGLLADPKHSTPNSKYGAGISWPAESLDHSSRLKDLSVEQAALEAIAKIEAEAVNE